MKANLPRLAVLVSGNGTNLQAVLDACASGEIQARVSLVLSNSQKAFALQRAERAGVQTLYLPRGDMERTAYDKELAYSVSSAGADLVVLAGWNRLLSSHFVSHHVTVNLHPALPGTFPGLGAIERAFAAWQDGEIEHSGVMVHYVPDEGVDDGPTIGTQKVAFETGDTLETFEARMHAAEHTLLVSSISKALTNLKF